MSEGRQILFSWFFEKTLEILHILPGIAGLPLFEDLIILPPQLETSAITILFSCIAYLCVGLLSNRLTEKIYIPHRLSFQWVEREPLH
jgi:hypothetical protein